MWASNLLKNKLYAVLLVILGYLTVCIEHDVTIFILTLILAPHLFFSRKSWFI